MSMARRMTSISDTKKTNVRDSFKALRHLPRFFKEIWNTSPGLFSVHILARLLNSLTPVAILWVGKLLIDAIIEQISAADKDFTEIWQYVGIELILAVCSDLLSRLVNLTGGLLGDLYSNDSSVRIIRKTNELTIAQLEDPDFYDKLEMARTQTSSRVNLLTTALSQIQSIISMLSLVAGLIYFEPLLLILLILSIIPLFISEIRFSSERYSLAKSWTAERRELDYLRYIGASDKTAKELKLFGLTDFIAHRFKDLSHQYFLLNKRLTIKRTYIAAIFNLLGILCYYGAYVLIIYRVLNGLITIGELTFLSGSFNRLRNNLQDFFGSFTRMTESALYLKDYFDFIDLKLTKEEVDTVPLPEKMQVGLQVKNLSFKYPATDTYILKDISFDIKAGEKMAFVGQNGAGKTTLIKLLLRFYEPTAGEILLDGTPITRFNVSEYQQKFGVIFQDFFRYEFTVKENIAVGNILEVDNMPKIEQAAERSLAAEVVADLPDGYAQQLGKRFIKGHELSGGQWQKIALARAYIKDADILILDEPTSALDAKAEYDVFKRFIGLTEGKTSVIISHRFSTVRMADRILVLQHGKIEELGTHEELMKNKSLYSELFDLQAEGYK